MDVTIVGSCVQDLISYTPRFPKPGESVRGSRFVSGYGGKGANQAVQAALLGAKVAMVAKVGNDVFGPPTIQNFKAYGINTDDCSIETECSTGSATITVADNGENNIVVVLGANERLTENDVIKAQSTIANSKLLLCQLEIPQPAILAAFQLAQKHNVRILFNPAPGLPDLNKELLAYADILCPNENEAEMLTDMQLKGIEDAHRITAKIRTLVKDSCVVIITLGEKGCVYSENVNSPIEHIPANLVKAVDTTGAGDSFVGSLAYFLSNRSELSFKECLQRSLAIASISVQNRGTQTSYLPKQKLPTSIFQ